MCVWVFLPWANSYCVRLQLCLKSMNYRCIAYILSGKETAVFNYPCISHIKTHDYIILQQSAPKSLV